MDSLMNQLAREMTDAIASVVAKDPAIEACREKARAAGLDMRVSLETVIGFADRGGGARALDAGLLITTRRADDARIEAVVAAAASADEDPVIKLRVLDVAARVLDDGRRARLLEMLAKDDASGLVRRAIDRLAPR